MFDFSKLKINDEIIIEEISYRGELVVHSYKVADITKCSFYRDELEIKLLENLKNKTLQHTKCSRNLKKLNVSYAKKNR